jgi:hypothetical protein
MSRRYVLLIAAVMLSALALTAMGRMPRTRTPAEGGEPEPAAETLAFEIRDGAMTPAVASVPVGRRIVLRVSHHGGRAATLALAGYEDRLPPRVLAPGEVWTAELIADRPGEDFAWTLDGRFAGRFNVTGAHLVEGHR